MFSMEKENNTNQENTILYANIVNTQLTVFYKLLLLLAIKNNIELFFSKTWLFLTQESEFNDDFFDNIILKTMLEVFWWWELNIKINESDELCFNTKELKTQFRQLIKENINIEFITLNSMWLLKKFKQVFVFAMIMLKMWWERFLPDAWIYSLLKNINNKMYQLLENFSNENYLPQDDGLYDDSLNRFKNIIDEKFNNLYNQLLWSVSKDKLDSHLKIVDSTKRQIQWV